MRPRGYCFDSGHAMVCLRQGFVSIKQDELSDKTAEVLQKVCKDVEVESGFQLNTGGETFLKTVK
ncbi:hypothetical protein SK128_012034, partial [Halocaridina rubra]